MPNETIQAQAISEWNPLAKKQLPLCQWLENHQGPEEQSRLKAVGNIVIPPCARLALHCILHSFSTLH